MTPRSQADVELLKQLVLGQLPVAETERLAVEYADDERLEELAEVVAGGGDTLVDSLRHHQTPDDSNADRLVGRLIERLKTADASKVSLGDTLALSSHKVPDAQAIPEQLEYFHIRKILGQGGMGTVYLADDTRLGRQVALKTLKRELAANPAAKDRFLREARSAARLHHDHIIPIYYVGEADGTPFLAMPFLQGEPLDDRLKREGRHKPLPLSEAIRIAREVALGLAAAHAQGLIHRDIKPANVWLEAPTGRAKLLDFGLARSQEESGQLTASGAILGTPAYMAPEQARGKSVDGRADLFSLGVMLYEMTTGQRPFTGENTMAILSSLALDDPAPPSQLNPAIPPDLSDLILKLLSKAPDQRPASAGIVAEVLAGFQMRTARPLVEALPSAAPASATVVDPWRGLDEDAPAAPPAAKNTSAKLEERKRGNGLKLAIAAAVLFVIGGGFAAYKLVFESKDGTLTVSVDGDADVRFKNGELHIYDETGKEKYTLRPGQRSQAVAPGNYKVSVTGADGLKLETDKFEMTKAGQVTVRVTAGPTVIAKADGEGPPDLGKAGLAAPNYALRFNGPGEFNIADNVRLDISKPWTVESWVNCPDPKLPVGEQMPFWASYNFNIAIQNFPDKGPRWSAVSQSGPDRNMFHAPAVFDRWVHVATVHDGKQIALFVDGVPQTVPNRVTLPKRVDIVNLGPNKYYATEGRPGFRGLMDEIRVSSVARYTAKFSPQRRFEPDDQTVALAHCDEGEGDVLKDSSGNGHHGTIVGAKWVKIETAATAAPMSAPPPAVPGTGHALAIGKEGHVKVPSLEMDAAGPLTLEGYVTLTADSGNYRDVVGLTAGFNALGVHSSGRWHFLWQPEKGVAQAMGPPVVKNKRFHLAGVMTGDKLLLFLDGKRIQETVIANRPSGTRKYFWLGANLDGILDEVRVSKVARYDKDFTPAQRFEPDADTLALYHFDEGTGDEANDSSGNNHHGKIVGARWVKADAASAEPDRKAAEYVLSVGGNARIIENGKEGNPKTIAELPRGLFELRIADLKQNEKVTDAGLAIFKDCKNLTHLFLQNSPVSDTGLAHLKECKNLTLLALNKTKVTAAGIDVLKKSLPDCKIDWDGSVIEPVVTDRAAAEATLKLGGFVEVRIGDQARSADDPKKLPAENFKLVQIGLTDRREKHALPPRALQFMKGLPHLESFLVHNSNVTDEDLKSLEGNSSLIKFKVVHGDISGKSLKFLANATNLELVDMWSMPVSDDEIRALAGHRRLVFVSFGGSGLLTDKAMQTIGQWKKLRSLGLEWNKITDVSMGTIGGLDQLETLILNNNPVTDDGLAQLHRLNLLKKLDVRGCKVTKAGVQKFAAARPDCRIEWDGGVIEPKKD